MSARTERTALLIGEEAVRRLSECHVTVAGLGGVGGHCAEALARAGVGRLHLIDCDEVTESNRNRQLVALATTVGMRKTDAMRARLIDAAGCAVTAADVRIDDGTADGAVPAGTDFLVDAVDDVSAKLALIRLANARKIPIVSCMGAGNRLDPTQFTVKDIFDTAGDPLARKLRQALRKSGVSSLAVVCSKEPAHAAPGQRTIGSFAPATAAAGLTAAWYVLTRLWETKAPEGTEGW